MYNRSTDCIYNINIQYPIIYIDRYNKGVRSKRDKLNIQDQYYKKRGRILHRTNIVDPIHFTTHTHTHTL